MAKSQKKVSKETRRRRRREAEGCSNYLATKMRLQATYQSQREAYRTIARIDMRRIKQGKNTLWGDNRGSWHDIYSAYKSSILESLDNLNPFVKAEAEDIKNDRTTRTTALVQIQSNAPSLNESTSTATVPAENTSSTAIFTNFSAERDPTHTTNTFTKITNSSTTENKMNPTSEIFGIDFLPSQADKETIRVCLSHGSLQDVISKCGDEPVTLESFITLQHCRWLDDSIINAYIKNLLGQRDIDMNHNCLGQRSHFFSTFFMSKMFDTWNENSKLRDKYNYDNIKRWSRKVAGGNVFRMKKISPP